MTKSLQLALLTLLLSVAGWMPATASTLTLNFTGTFSNNTEPAGPGPWVRATFNDAIAADGYDVRLTLDIIGLTDDEFITEMGFNLNTLYEDSAFTYNIVSGTNGALEGVAIDSNAFKADGDGYFDVALAFSANPPRATDGNSYVIDFNLVDGMLVASSFNFLSYNSESVGPFLGAAHLQGIAGDPNGTSTWLYATTTGFPPPPPPPPPPENPVPEPTSIVLLGTGLLGLARGYVTRRRKR